MNAIGVVIIHLDYYVGPLKILAIELRLNAENGRDDKRVRLRMILAGF